MEASEYANLAAVEQEHWYYSGKRELVRAWIQRLAPPRHDQVLLDCGAGTGLFAEEMQSLCRVLVLDDHEEALRMLRGRFRPEQVLTLVDGRVPLPDQTLDYVSALDVLEHVADDAQAVREFRRLLKPGGLAAITVPASMALWSDWDEALHHHRRYDRARLTALFPAGEWDILHVNYTNVLVYPAVWAVRRWRGVSRAVGRKPAQRSEDKLPPRFVNHVLRRVFVGTGLARVPFPIGVSLLLIARRRA